MLEQMCVMVRRLPHSDLSASEFQALVVKAARQVLNRLGAGMVQYNGALKFARSLAPVLRNYYGPQLADELVCLFCRWERYGVDYCTAQAIARECYRALNSGVESPRPEA